MWASRPPSRSARVLRKWGQFWFYLFSKNIFLFNPRFPSKINGTENSDMVKFEYQTFNLLDLSHVNQGPECRKTLDSSQHSSALHLHTTMVQAQKIYPINLLDLSHANHEPARRMTAVSTIPIAYRQQYGASAKALPHFYHTAPNGTIRQGLALPLLM